MRRSGRIVGAVCLGAALVACGGAGEDGAPAEQSSPAPTSEDAGRTEVPDACSLVTDEQAGEIVGAEVSGEPASGADTAAEVSSCAFAPVAGEDGDSGDSGDSGDDEPADAPSLDVQTSAAAGASFAEVRAGFGGGENARAEDLRRPDGSDGAVLVTEEDELLDVATAVALRDDVIYVVLGSSTEVEEARRVARDGLEAALG